MEVEISSDSNYTFSDLIFDCEHFENLLPEFQDDFERQADDVVPRDAVIVENDNLLTELSRSLELLGSDINAVEWNVRIMDEDLKILEDKVEFLEKFPLQFNETTNFCKWFQNPQREHFNYLLLGISSLIHNCTQDFQRINDEITEYKKQCEAILIAPEIMSHHLKILLDLEQNIQNIENLLDKNELMLDRDFFCSP